MPRLILVNGSPGVGKSTLARRYLQDHPLALLVEVDDLRTALGEWKEHEESKLQARALALALARTHLEVGHDVVVPQYLGRIEFVDELEAVATGSGARFDHLIIDDDEDAIVRRFRTRRDELAAAGDAHPQADVADHDIEAVIADARRRLTGMSASRTDIHVVDAQAGDPYRQLLAALR